MRIIRLYDFDSLFFCKMRCPTANLFHHILEPSHFGITYARIIIRFSHGTLSFPPEIIRDIRIFNFSGCWLQINILSKKSKVKTKSGSIPCLPTGRHHLTRLKFIFWLFYDFLVVLFVAKQANIKFTTVYAQSTAFAMN